MDISVIICAYNEAEALPTLLNAVTDHLQFLDHELIVVDDGSTDQTLNRLLASTVPHLTVVALSRNFGQSAALAAGVRQAQGRYVVTLDGDGQNDPADIPHLLHLAQTLPADMVAGIRQKRQDGWLLRRLPSQWANRIIRSVTGVPHPDFGCTLKVMDADLARLLPLYGDWHRFMPAFAKAEGARIVSQPVRHHPRRSGVSKYNLRRTYRVMADLLFVGYWLRYGHRPIQFFGVLALMFAALGLGAGVLMAFGVGSWLLGLLGVPMLAGVLLGLGLMAETRLQNAFRSGQFRPYRVRQVYDRVMSQL